MLEEKWGVSAAAPVAVAAAAAGRRGGGRAGRGADRVRRHPDRRRRQEDQRHQGGSRGHQPRPEGSQGSGRGCAEDGEGRREEGRSRADQEEAGRGGRDRRDQVGVIGVVDGVGADRRPYIRGRSRVTRRPAEAQTSRRDDAHPPAWVIAAAGTAGASRWARRRRGGRVAAAAVFVARVMHAISSTDCGGRAEATIERRDYRRGSSMANSFTGRKRVRKSFGRIAAAVDDAQPDRGAEELLRAVPAAQHAAEQRSDTGLQEVFKSVFPISDFSSRGTLEFVKYEFEEPKYDVEECQQRGMTYAAPLKVTLRLVVWDIDDETGARSIRDIKEQDVYMGELLNAVEEVNDAQKRRLVDKVVADFGERLARPALRGLGARLQAAHRRHARGAVDHRDRRAARARRRGRGARPGGARRGAHGSSATASPTTGSTTTRSTAPTRCSSSPSGTSSAARTSRA